MILHSNKLSAILMSARSQKGFSQTYMANGLGISQKAYSYIESGRCKLEIFRFLKIAQLTETHPMQFLMKICEGAPSWECKEAKEAAMSIEIEKLEAQINFLKSENSFLRSTIDKILDKEKNNCEQI
jgi:transcriptional regulator with XRE-family HTH domain